MTRTHAEKGLTVGKLDEARARAFEANERLASQLATADLYFEVDFAAKQIREVRAVFGDVARHLLRWQKPDEIIRRYPALALVSMSGHAALDYGYAGYWDSFWQALKLAPNHDFESALRHSLEDLFSRFCMRPLDDLIDRNRYVGALAVHAGIPVSSIPNVLWVIEEYGRTGYELSGRELFQWLMEPGKAHRGYKLGQPVLDFMHYGGAIAVEILDRIIEFLQFTVDQPDTWKESDLSRETTGLPGLWLEGILERLEECPFGGGSRNSAGRVRRRRSTLRYSLDDEQVMIEVPYPEHGADTPWRLSYRGETRLVYSKQEWGVESAADQPPTLVAVTARTREVVLTHAASSASQSVAVIDSDDPLLLFTIEGRLVRLGTALPRDEVLALMPGNATLLDARRGDALEPIGPTHVPSGWTGWEARRYDLRGYEAIQVQPQGKEAGAIRGVRSVGSPAVNPQSALPGLRTPDGMPVYGARPEVELPPHLGAHAQEWRTVARNSTDRSVVSDIRWLSESEPTVLDAFSDAAPGLIGRFEVEVSEVGRSGTGSIHRQPIFLAESLRIEYDDEFRLPTGNGLSPITAWIGGDSSISVEPEEITFGPDLRETTVRVSGRGGAFNLVLAPPHFESRVDQPGTPANWGIAPKKLAPKDLAELRVIAARVPAAQDVDFVLLDEAGSVVQEQTPSKPVAGTYQVSTQVFRDTAVALGISTVIARVDDSRAQTYEVPVLTLSPAALFTDVRLAGSKLVFAGLSAGDYHSAWVWSATAPWRTVENLEIDDGVATLPGELRDAGDLLVQVFIDDPFNIVPRPQAPDGSAKRVPQPHWYSDPIPELEALAKYLAGKGELPSGEAAVSGSWAALAVLPWIREQLSERLRTGLVALLGRHPRVALEELGESLVPDAQRISLLVETGLAEKPFSAADTFNELHPDPRIGTLVEISDLPGLRRNGETVRGEYAETLGYLKDKGGYWLMELLAGGGLESASVGIFGADVLLLDSMTEEQVSDIFDAARLVPGALLDNDTRTAAVAEAFLRRHSWVEDPAAVEVSSATERLRDVIGTAAPHAAGVINARVAALGGVDTEEHPWLLVSVQSLTLALAGRLEARAMFEKSPITAALRKAWTAMAGYFPELIVTDLLIADALAAHATHGALVGGDL